MRVAISRHASNDVGELLRHCGRVVRCSIGHVGAEQLKKFGLEPRDRRINRQDHSPIVCICTLNPTMSTCKSLLRACPSQRQAPSLLPLTQCRLESTTRRHRKLLALPEAPSYTANDSSPTLVFNPPSSAPNVYHTPVKFMPKEDKRRQLHASAQEYAFRVAHARQTSPIAAPGTPLHTTTTGSRMPPRPSSALPTAVRAPYEKKYHVSEAEVAEMRRLRSADPDTWTRVRLAEKFGCSQFFVGLVAKNAAKAERVERDHEDMRRKWGQRRREAREDRGRRKLLWGRDA